MLLVRSVCVYFGIQSNVAAARALSIPVEGLAATAAETRAMVRAMASRFQLLPEDRSGLALVDENGTDIELKRIFGVLD